MKRKIFRPSYCKWALCLLVSVLQLISCSTEEQLPETGDGTSKLDTAQLTMLEANFLPGDFYREHRDSIELIFNTPIQLINLKGITHCPHDFNPVLTNNNTRLQFHMGCMQMGASGDYEVIVKDSAGNVLTERFNVGFYNDSFEFEGRLIILKYEEESNTIWLLTDMPNQLYNLDASALTVRKKIGLPFIPLNLHRSVYNNNLYILGETPIIHIYDPESLQKIQDIDIFQEPAPYDHPDYPAIIPYDIAFTKSGKGLVLFKADLNSANKVRIIDASSAHRIYNLPQNDVVLGPQYDFLAGGLQLSRDQNTIIVNELHGVSRLHIFDPVTEYFTEKMPLLLGIAPQIELKRHSDLMFNFQGYLQHLWYPDGSFSSVTEFPIRYFRDATFSYHENEPETVYMLFNYFFIKADFMTMEVKGYYAEGGGTKVIAYPDGQHLLFYNSHGCLGNINNGCSFLLRVPTHYFSR